MWVLIGLVIVVGSILGGYVMGHGKLLALWQPNELIIIGGAGIGSLLIANPFKVILAMMHLFPRLFKPSRYNKMFYMDLLGLMFELFSKARREGLIALEDDIEEPESSELFARFPTIIAEASSVEFITDYMRMIVAGNMTAFELENLMDAEIETHHQQHMLPSTALSQVSDAMPGFGIVAAVMGIVVTMGSLGGPPEELGGHVAAALVGTFLGILLAYGFLGPMSTAMEHFAREDQKFLECIKVCMLSTVNGMPPQISVEFGRKTLYTEDRPSFQELETAVRRKKE